ERAAAPACRSVPVLRAQRTGRVVGARGRGAPPGAVLPRAELAAGSAQRSAVQLDGGRRGHIRLQLAEVPAVLRADPRSRLLLPVDRGRAVGLAPSLE